MNSIPQYHPAWCDETRCHAFDRAFGQHRSEPFDFRAPGVEISVVIHRADPGWHVETFTTVTISFTDHLAALLPDAAFTITVDDLDRLGRHLTRVVEAARGADQ